jgi:hypothetical protein
MTDPKHHVLMSPNMYRSSVKRSSKTGNGRVEQRVLKAMAVIVDWTTLSAQVSDSR